MDKQEYRIKMEKMHQLIKEKDYEQALEIAESIDWKKVKNIGVLYAASEVYEKNKEYQKSRDILFLAYDKAPDSKKIVYKLAILAIKMGEVKEAMDCYEEFVALAPKDPNGYILKYKILKAKNAPLEEQITTLEEFKKIEYVEKWAYELALLYRDAGMLTECLEECDDLIVWFSEGKYIYKAMELKMNYKPLTPIQHEKYLNRPEAQPIVTEQPEQEEVAVQEETEQQEEVAVEEKPEQQEELAIQEEPEQQEEIIEKPNLSIEEMVQDWQETQKENAQIIQAELQRVEQEKAEIEAQKEEEPEEQREEILSNDVRKLMEELEAESAEIDASKTAKEETEPENEKPLLQKVVEQLSALDVKIEFPAKEIEEPEEINIPINNEPIELEEEEEGLKLGDTQSMALAAKAVAEAAEVEVPQVQIPSTPISTKPVQQLQIGDTGFVVQGKYDLNAQAEIGTKLGLTDEQRELFSYFVPVHGMSEQLVKVLQDDKECKTRYGTSRIGNVVIVGRRGSGKTVLAVDIVKAIQKQRKTRNGKVAIVKAESLNKKNVQEIAQKLNGGALVIEKASRLNKKTIDDLCEMMEGQTGELLVVLEDERKPMAQMMSEHPHFDKKFTSRIEIPVFINDELVTFGQTYAKENGYKIDEMGILALYSDIDILQREEKVVTVSDVKAIIDDAIENANKPSLKKLAKTILGRNKDKSRRVILKEEHFR